MPSESVECLPEHLPPAKNSMITVVPADGDLRQTALTLLHSRLAPGERETQLAAFLGSVQRGELTLDDLLLATVGGEPAGALLFVRQPGRMAFLWPPVVPVAGNCEAVSDALLRGAAARLDAQGVQFVQCILELEDDANRELLIRNGFQHAADLLFLRRSLREPLPLLADGRAEETNLNWLPFDERHRGRFVEILDRTYSGTRDCPLLSRVRNAADALAWHRGTGSFDPARWRICRRDGVDAGVLLLGEDLDQNTWEVVYLGVVPEWRGQGLGRAMLRSALEQARDAGRLAMHLAVDSTNTYAINIYNRIGFTVTTVRGVYLRMTPER